MKTTVPGLWAIGDTSYAGSAWAGAAEAPPGRLRGSGLMNALISGFDGMLPPCAKYIEDSSPAKLDNGEIARLKEKIFAPLNREPRLLGFRSHTKHSGSGGAREIQHAQEQGKVGRSLVQSGVSPGKTARTIRRRIRTAWSSAMKLPVLHCAPKSASEQLWPALKAEAGITGKIIPSGMTRTGSSGSLLKKCRKIWLSLPKPIPIERYQNQAWS